MVIQALILILKGKVRDLHNNFTKILPLVLIYIILGAFTYYGITYFEAIDIVNMDKINLAAGIILILYSTKLICFSKYPSLVVSLPAMYNFTFSKVGLEKLFIIKLFITTLIYGTLGLVLGWGVEKVFQIEFTILLAAFYWASLYFPVLAGWIVYTMNEGHSFLSKLLINITILIALFISYKYRWIIIIFATLLWILSIRSIRRLNWYSYEKDCRLTYLTGRALLQANYGELQSIAIEYKRTYRERSFISELLYFPGIKALVFKDIVTLSRFGIGQFLFIFGAIILFIFLGLNRNPLGLAFAANMLINFVHPLFYGSIKVLKNGSLYPYTAKEYLATSLIIPSVLIIILFMPIAIAYGIGYNNMKILLAIPFVLGITLISYYNAFVGKFLNFISLALLGSTICVFYAILMNRIILFILFLISYLILFYIIVKLICNRLKQVHLIKLD